MRRFLLVFLPLLLLCACAREAAFAADADGYGYTHRKTGAHYAMLDEGFEPLTVGAAQGAADGGATLYAIGGLDAALWLTDGAGAVFYAGETPPVPDGAAVNGMLWCERDAASVVLARYGEDSPLPAALFSLWQAGETGELPLGEQPRLSRAVRWLSPDFAGLSYGVLYVRYEQGDYLYDLMTKRAVRVPDDTAGALPD